MNKRDIIQQVLENRSVRIAVARQSFEWFFSVYLNEFLTYETAAFQKKMFEIAEDTEESLSVILSFRGSAKTTIMALAYPIWSILGVQQRKFVVIICDTQDIARQRLANIRKQLEQNRALKAELGPFREDPPSEWSAGSIVIPRYGARVMCVSRGQSVRGVIHDQHRPDVIILDDVENLESVRTKDSRDKTYRWFVEEIQILGDKGTKIIMIGNKLHEDSLSMRLIEQIKKNERSGKYYEFPVCIDGYILWPGKYPDQEALDKEKKRIGDERAWAREYELKIVPEDNQIVYREWVKYYDELPQILRGTTSYLATGIDLALVKKEHADYTAMVTARVILTQKSFLVHILPYPINKRLNFPEQREAIESLVQSHHEPYHYLFIESFGTQGALVTELDDLGYKAEGVTPAGSKDERLRYVSHLVKNGKVQFPHSGTEALISQLINFGVETHDDLADAFAILLIKIMERKDRGGFSGPINISKQDFYDIKITRERSEDWAEREDRAMLKKVNSRSGSWTRLMG